MASKLVFVTGASGFTGSHVISQLLQQGYRVRGSVRSGKADAAKASYAKYGDRVEIFVVDDLINGDFTEVLKDVYGVIHVASPYPGHQDLQTTIDIAVEGALNVVRQAYALGTRRVSFISSVIAFVDPATPVYTRLVRSTDWNPLTVEDARMIKNDMITYSVSKKSAEKALWKFAEKHPDLNFVSVGPPVFLGPFTPEFLESLKPGDALALSSAIYIYNFITGPPNTAGKVTYGYVDVRDVARAVVAAIDPKVPGSHRLLISSLPWFDNGDIAAHIAAIRPDLKDRVIKAESSEWKAFIAEEEIRKTVEVLGFGEMTPWKKTVEDSLESILEMEKIWKEKGVDVDEVLGKNWALDFMNAAAAARVELN